MVELLFQNAYFVWNVVLSVVAGLVSNPLPPAEDAFVRTSKAGGRLHTPVGLDAIESMFVTATSPSQHRLRKETTLRNLCICYVNVNTL